MTFHPRGAQGQTTVELALVLPVLVVVILAIAQVSLVLRDQVLVTHAAREAVRSAAVVDDVAAARDAARRGAQGLDADRLEVRIVSRGPAGGAVEVRVVYRSSTDLPIVGPLMGDVTLDARAVMRVEG